MPVSLKAVKQRKGDLLPVKETCDISPWVTRHPDIARINPLTFMGTVEFVSDLYHVKGDITGDMILKCSRCLAEFTHSVDVPFERSFIEEGKRENDEETDEEYEILVSIDGELDLLPYVAEEFLLSVPLVPLCREHCLGLCPQCGGNRNEKACECKTERIDPRLSVLADWFEKDGQ